MKTSRHPATPSASRLRPAWFLVLLTTLLMGAASTASAIQIYVTVPTVESVLPLEVDPEDLVHDVKQQLQDGTTSQYFAVSDQVLVFNEEILEDDRTLASYDIEDESELELRLPKLEAEKNRIFAQAYRFHAQMNKGRKLKAEIKRFDRRTSASFRALKRARTPAAFSRAKARLRSQIRRFDSEIGRFSASIRQMNALFVSVAALNRDLGGGLAELDELVEVVAELEETNAVLAKVRRELRGGIATINRLKFPKA